MRSRSTRDVVPDRGEVDDDLGAGPAHAADSFHPRAEQARRTVPGCAAATSPATQRPAARRRGSPRRRAARSRPRRRRTASRPAASSAPTSPPSTSPAPAVASHGGPVVVTRTRPSGCATSVWRPLSSTTAPYVSAARAGVVERPRLDVGALDAEHRGQLAGVRGEHRRHAERAVDVGRARRRRRRAGRRRPARRASSSPAPSPPPEPTTQACTRPAPTTSGWRPADPVGDRVAPDVAHHADQPAGRAGDAEQRGAGVAGRAGADADHAAGVLVRRPARAAAAAGDVLGLQRLDRRRRGRSSPMSTRCTAPQAGAAGSTRWRDLVGAEGDGERGARRAARRARRCRRRRRSGCRPRRPGRRATSASAAPASGRSPGRPPMPDDPVDDDVGRRCRRGARRRPGRRRARSAASPPSCAWSDEQPRLDRAPRAGPARAPAYSASPPLLPGPDQQQHPRAVRRRRAGRRTAYASPAAARCISAPSGSRAISASSAARTCSTVCAGSPITLARRASRTFGRRHARERAERPRLRRRPAPTPLQHHDGRGDAGVVGEREVHRGDAERRRRGAATEPRSTKQRAAGGLGDDLGVVPVQPDRGAERLGERLLGGEPGGQRGRREGAPRRA